MCKAQAHTATAIACDEKGFNVPSGGVIENSKGDAMYEPVLSMWDDTSNDCRIKLEVMDAGGDYPPQRLAEINGTGHKITLTNHLNKRREISIPIVFGRSFYNTPQKSDHCIRCIDVL